jgi:uncharacterized membrane protein
MGGLVFLVILTGGAFLFAVFGVIALLGRTARQTQKLVQLEARLEGLERQIPVFEKSVALGRERPSYHNEKPEEPADAKPGAPETAEVWEPGSPETAAWTAAAAQEAPSEIEEAPGTGAVSPEPVLWNSVKTFIHGGSLWAGGGVALLIAAFAMLITYLAGHGFFTVDMGIVGAAFSGLLMLVLGWRFRRRRPVYFLILQGGGIGILYLSVFAAYKLTPYFSPLVSIVLMSLLLPPSVVLAVFQNSQPLAIFGFLGGFAAPILLASGEGGHVFFFSYYTVLSIGVMVIGYYRLWRGLNALAFLCSFGSALYWVMTSYEPRLFWTAEPFLAGFILIFTLLGLNAAGKKMGETKNYLDPILILGTPFGAALLQWKVFSYVEHGYTLVSIVFSALYLLLTVLILMRRDKALRPVAEGYLGLGVLLANLIIPLELSPEITSAVWAAEGVLIFFFGLRRKDIKIEAAGIVVHAAGAISFALEENFRFVESLPFRSPRFTGSLVIAVSALAMVLLANGSGKKAPLKEAGTGGTREAALFVPFSIVMTVWAYIWWFAGWFFEFYRVLDYTQAAFFILSSLTALLVFAGARFFRAPILMSGALPALIHAAAIALGFLFSRTTNKLYFYDSYPLSVNYFNGPYGWGWLAFFLAQPAQFFLSRNYFRGKEGKDILQGIWIFTDILIALTVLSFSGRFYTMQWGLSVSWTSFAGLLPSFAVMIGLSLFYRSRSGFSQGNKTLIFFVLPLILSIILGAWFLVTLFLPGDPAPLPVYIPILNPLDLLEGFCIAAILFRQIRPRAGPREPGSESRLPSLSKGAFFALGDSMVFLWLTAILARSFHFYGAIPYSRIFESPGFHVGLFIFWALYGIAHIIAGRRLSMRPVWIAGAVLTVTDIAKLLLLDLAGTGIVTRIIPFFIAGFILLFIGWAAPLPPAAGQGPPKDASPEKT